MELTELIRILRQEARLFWVLVGMCFLAALLWQGNQPQRFEASLLLNIGRAGVAETREYTYDGFYRLQADERFADTVVRWLGSPRIVEDIYREAHLNPDRLSARDLRRAFEAGRLSSQVIEVRYRAQDQNDLPLLAAAGAAVLNRYTVSLNVEKREPNWFVIIASEPVIRDARIGLGPTLALALLVGAFIAFWTVIIKAYFKKK